MFKRAEHERDVNTPVPVCYHSIPLDLAEDLLHTYNLEGVLDLTRGDGVWAFACVKARKPYLGVEFNETHGKMLSDWLATQIFKRMQVEDDPLYQSGLVEILV